MPSPGVRSECRPGRGMVSATKGSPGQLLPWETLQWRIALQVALQLALQRALQLASPARPRPGKPRVTGLVKERRACRLLPWQTPCGLRKAVARADSVFTATGHGYDAPTPA
ncbi:hypothetical protein GCM10010358_73340 [Streptomyces minutiscleroticus]|uniref:Uncharacterized protein n=1 Tax=Streptomyces minutiscleroticus TaxID=68238 RepID=A0A918P027_9ACTN|nr:hypothetical protein GCM10010358_73340 [Streptomyces minutiscleroticus]